MMIQKKRKKAIDKKTDVELLVDSKLLKNTLNRVIIYVARSQVEYACSEILQ